MEKEKYYRDEYILEVEEMKRTFKAMMNKNNAKITKEKLMHYIFILNGEYLEKRMPRIEFLLNVEMVRQLWEELFNTELGGFIYGDSKTTRDFDTWDERIN